MPSKSKNKGNSWERDVANFLSALYSTSFIRAPGSGAFIGGSNGHRKQVLLDSQIRNFKGDIVPGEGFGRLNIECKSYADFPFHQLFQGEVKILEGWIGQCLEVADEGDFNVLFLKFNRKGKWVVFEAEHAEHCDLERHFLYRSSKFGDWIMMDFTVFWEKNSEVIKRLAK